jgi:transcriptional regulator with XRE-family HTH domain
MTLGDRILAILGARGLSQRDAAKRAGIERSHFSRMARGIRPIGDDALARIAKALGLSVAELIAGTDRAPRPDETAALLARVAELEAALAARPTHAEHDRLRRHLRALEHTAQALAAERDELIAQRDQRPCGFAVSDAEAEAATCFELSA